MKLKLLLWAGQWADLAAADAAAAAALPAGIASSELGLIIFLTFGEYSDADKGLARNSLAMVVAVIGFLKRRLQSAAVWGWLTYWQAALLETIFQLDGASQARARDVRPESSLQWRWPNPFVAGACCLAGV